MHIQEAFDFLVHFLIINNRPSSCKKTLYITQCHVFLLKQKISSIDILSTLNFETTIVWTRM